MTRMKFKILGLFLFILSNVAFAEPYVVISAQATTGQNDLYRSTSVLTNIGLGYETDWGGYVDWVVGVNAEVIAEILLEDHSFIDVNQQSGQMDLVVGYKVKVTNNTYLRFGAGIETAIFEENCIYSFKESRNLCNKKTESGATYKLAYLLKTDRSTLLGLEFNRDELSRTRKYNGLSFVINGRF